MKELIDLYLVGAGAFGRETADTIHEINKKTPTFCLKGFIDDWEEIQGTEINGIPVLGKLEHLIEISKASNEKPYAVVTLANPQAKEKLVQQLDKYVCWENIIHPMVLIKESAKIGTGNIIQHFSSISSNATVMNHCIVNCNCVIGHDVILEDYVSIMPQVGLMGHCKIEPRVYIGTGAKLIQGVSVGTDAIIGAGAVVLSDVSPDATVVGNPVHRIK